MILKKLREDAGISRETLGRMLNVSAMTIRNWENGDTEPSASQIISMADIFDVTTDRLLAEKENDQ